MKYGYIRKTNTKKPFLYVLTAEGNLHAKNPYIAVDENIQKYRNMLLQRMKEIIEGQPELFKNIYESIYGSQQNNIINSCGIVNNSSQYSDYDIGNKDDVIDEIRGKIEDKTFFTNVNEDKLESLVNGLLNDSLTQEEKKQLIIDALYNAANTNKGSITIKHQEYQSNKPVGERNYYSILANSINHPVTKSLYDAIPFRFMRVGKEIRLKSRNENGLYRNNKDGIELDFDVVNRQYFQNRMTIKTKPNPEKRELEFYYVGGHNKFIEGYSKCQITTMSFDDYEKAKSITSPKLTIKIRG
ncbi:MAG TPA: hypothetical protein HA261_11555 [Methanosarcina sp.]|nr:hypothetical protein [Methanosarcina sp.]